MKKHLIIFLIIFSFAFILKMIILVNWHGLTFDEMVSADLAQKSLAEVIYYSQWETHPPLYYLVLNIWGHIFGQFETSWRSLSLLISLSSLVAFYFLAKELFGKKAGLVAMFLFFISVFFNFYGLWMRMHGLAILLSILSLYFYIKIVKQNSQNYLWIICYLLATVASLHTHLFSLFMIFAQALYLIYLFFKKSINRKKFIMIFVYFGVIVLAFSPWFIFGFIRKLSTINSNAWYFFDHIDGTLGLFSIITSLFALTDNVFLSHVGFTVLLIAFILALIVIRQEKVGWNVTIDNSASLVYSVLIFAVPFFLTITIGLYRLRFYYLPAIGLALIVSYGLAKIKKYEILAITLAIIFYLSAFNLYYNAKSTDTGWPDVGAFIENNEQKGDIIIAAHPNHLLPLKFYYHKNLPQTIVGNDSPYRQDLTRTILENNIYSGLSDDSNDILKNTIKGRKRIFLVYSQSVFKTDQDKIKDWLKGNGWHTLKDYKNNYFDSPGVMLLLK